MLALGPIDEWGELAVWGKGAEEFAVSGVEFLEIGVELMSYLIGYG